MIKRRQFAFFLAAALASSALPAAAQYVPKVTMYKNPSCGCCGDWAKHMEANGFRVETQMMSDVTPVKQKFGVPESLYSCHTAVVGGYAIEGHVPAADIRRLLREKPAIKGLSVPGMVVGSPGMETGPAQRFATIAFSGSSKRVYAQH